MGSLGEEDLEMLVFDYIEPPVIVSDHEKSPRAFITLQEILEKKDEEEKEIEEKVNAFMRRRRLSYEGDDAKKDVMKKIVSDLRSDGSDASLSRTIWDSSYDLREGCRVFRHKVKYEYIDVMVTSDRDSDNASRRRVIIDLDFKSQFELAKPTKAYKVITEMLPRLFVAREERLKRVVRLVCGEMKQSMKEEGMHRPPWRTSRYMQAKWLSENRKRFSGSKKGSSSSVFNVGGEGQEAGGTSTTASKTKCCLPIF